ncbi:uncharacterized protein LOC142335350 [Convolutriloba macropyga]|uniref:uncharacterized protein LOC142335350 n=1 Tax=Convolutriloba macropyga TaxID=536237 RepID=UPI003F528849
MDYYSPIGVDEDDNDNTENESVCSEYQPLSNHFDEDPFVSNIIITDQVEKTTVTKCCDLIKSIILFPTKITVIFGLIAGLWLCFCISVLSLGAAFIDMCPGNPAVPQTMVIHASAWVAMCIYTLIRLMWIEVRRDRLPEFRCGRGVLDSWCYWRKEYTYSVDLFMMLLLVSTFAAEWMEVFLVQTGRFPVLYYFDIELVKWCRNCCLGYVMRVAMGQILLSTMTGVLLLFAYLYLFGILTKLRDLLCKKDIAKTKDEKVTLM